MTTDPVVIEVLDGHATLRVSGRRLDQLVSPGDVLTLVEPDGTILRHDLTAWGGPSALRELGAANLPVPTEDAEAAVLSVLTLHRRAHNTRACTGCDWTPPHAGGTDHGASTRRRNEDFNHHLAALITALFC